MLGWQDFGFLQDHKPGLGFMMPPAKTCVREAQSCSPVTGDMLSIDVSRLKLQLI